MKIWFMRSLTSKISVLLIVVLAVALGLCTYFQVRSIQNYALNNMREQVLEINAVLGAALHQAMQANDMNLVQIMLDKSSGIENVRRIDLMDDGGKVVKSSDKKAVGQTVAVHAGSSKTAQAEAMYRLSQTVEGRPYMKGITPIPADQGCLTCHQQKLGEPVGFLGMEIWADQDLAEINSARSNALLMNLATIRKC